MKTKNIEHLEKKVLKEKKVLLATVLDPILAGLDEMQKSFLSVFVSSYGENKITLSMDKFETKWLKRKI